MVGVGECGTVKLDSIYTYKRRRLEQYSTFVHFLNVKMFVSEVAQSRVHSQLRFSLFDVNYNIAFQRILINN